MKKSPIIFSLFGANELSNIIQKKCHYDLGSLVTHQYPDEETVIKIDSDVANRVVIFNANLNRPNIKLLPLLFAAETARSLGALKVVLIAPYLPYMRQDKVFEPGQGITSIYFAQLISHYFDALITIDPHLHRWHALSAIYDIPTHTLHAINTIAQWIEEHVKNPILIGPDAESIQWVKAIAEKANVPYLILEKTRKGDSTIEVSIPHIEKHRDAIPILVDDIISTGMTMMETIKHLHSLKMQPPICIGVHAVFAADAYQMLLSSGVEKIITCNTIPHVSNAIDISHDLIRLLMTKSSFEWNKGNE